MAENTIDFAALLAKVKANTTNPPPPTLIEQLDGSVVTFAPTPTSKNDTVTGMHGELITYNSKQQEFIDMAAAGKSCVLIGAAGTGKTTCSQGALKAILSSTDLAIPPLMADGHKHLQDNTPGVVICSYTRRAVNNIRKVQTEDLKNNCITIHKLLEYAPVYYEVLDPETNELKNTMRFEPSRNEFRPLPTSIHTIVIEEASMLGGLPKEMGEGRGELYNQLLAALSHEVQWIFIGDIQQLPPVFGPAITS